MLGFLPEYPVVPKKFEKKKVCGQFLAPILMYYFCLSGRITLLIHTPLIKGVGLKEHNKLRGF